MLKIKGNYYLAETKNTALLLSEEGYLYYGEKLFSYAGTETLPSTKPFSGWGTTDFSEPSVLVRHADGSAVTDFCFRSARLAAPTSPKGLPASFGAEKCLRLEYTDAVSKLKLVLEYIPYADCDGIAVRTYLVNGGKSAVQLERFASLQFERAGEYRFTTFDGAWGGERKRHTRPVSFGAAENASFAGSSSHFHNPFTLLSDGSANYGFNLVYSGNHRTLVSHDGAVTRVLVGINPCGFSRTLPAGETFFAPEAVMCFGKTEEEVSFRMREFVSRHIIPVCRQKKERPVLVNNWEGTYFDFTREKILGIAKKAKEIGAELFVLDDGWFGRRDDDTSSLGDWTDYTEKTGGIETLADEVRGMGLSFGIWMEPEMISKESELFSKHPEYCMRVPRRTPTPMRNQYMLNLADPKVQSYVFRAVSDVIVRTKAAYVKWDYNRYMTDCYDKSTAGGEYFHRYILGFYAVLEKLVGRFPDVLFEGCASGGGRFDLGILCYMPQIWTSDNTDARERIPIQAGTAAGYPQSSMGAHVSASPNEQTGNKSSLYTRFAVAIGGVLGYEIDLTKCSESELSEIKAQVAFYKAHRGTLQFGDYYPLGTGGAERGFICVGENGAEAVASVALLNKETGYRGSRFLFKGLDKKARYLVSEYRKEGGLKELALCGGDFLMRAGLFVSDFTDDESASNPVYTKIFLLERK